RGHTRSSAGGYVDTISLPLDEEVVATGADGRRQVRESRLCIGSCEWGSAITRTVIVVRTNGDRHTTDRSRSDRECECWWWSIHCGERVIRVHRHCDDIRIFRASNTVLQPP